MPVYYSHKEWDVCPYCQNRVSEVRTTILNTTIGPELATCPHCGGIYKTGKSEWANKSEDDKRAYHNRVIWWCIGSLSYMFGIFGIAFLIMLLAVKASIGLTLLVSLTIALIVEIFLIRHVLHGSRMEIEESLERTQGMEG